MSGLSPMKTLEPQLTPRRMFGAAPCSAAWVKCSDRLPPPDVDVETKIDDGRGVRNVEPLRRHSNLWWFTDMSMYIYYSPTHWRELPPNEKGQR